MEFLYSIVGLTIRKDTRRDVSIGVTFKNYFHNKDQIQDYQGGFHNFQKIILGSFIKDDSIPNAKNSIDEVAKILFI